MAVKKGNNKMEDKKIDDGKLNESGTSSKDNEKVASKVHMDAANEKSFLAKIADAKEAPPLAAFAAFPPEINFEGQDKGEEIILFIRKHPAIFIPKILTIVFMIFLPVILIPILGAAGIELTMGDVSFGIGILILWIMFTITYGIVNFFKWFFSVNIITTERIVDIDFDKVFYHNVAETQLESVEDVSHKPVGVWASFFDFGTVYVQTAGEQREFEFQDVPRPRDIQDTILDLLELKQKRNRNGDV
jgi:hypothetical protein